METMIQFAWLWVAVILVLMAGYHFLGASFLVWLGAGCAIFLLLPVDLPDLSNPLQVTIWLIVIAGYLAIWFLFIRTPELGKTERALSKQMLIGETGEVSRIQDDAGGGLVRFRHAVQGSSEWPMIPLGELQVGDEVTVVDLIGKSVVVKKP